MERQRAFYHKCHRCVFRGKGAEFELEPAHRNGAYHGAPALRDEAGAPAVK